MEGIFKTAMSGFKKEDVLTYIDKQEAIFKYRESVFEDKISNLSSALAQEKLQTDILTTRTGDLTAENERLISEYEHIKQVNIRLLSEAKKLNDDFEEARAEYLTLRNEMLAVKQGADEKSSAVTALESTVGELKAELESTREGRERISRVLLEAQKTADAIIKSAVAEASKIIGDAKSRLNVLLCKSEEFKGQIAGLRGNLSEFILKSGELLDVIVDSDLKAEDSFKAVFEQAELSDGNLCDNPAEQIEQEQAAPPEIEKNEDKTPENSLYFNFSRS